MKKTTAKRRIEDSRRILLMYRKQLFARHTEEPLKSPPCFLLDAVIAGLTNIAKGLGKNGA